MNPENRQNSTKRFFRLILPALFFFIIAGVLMMSALVSCRERSPYLDCRELKVPEGMKCIPGGFFIRGSNRTTVDEDSHRKVQDESPEMRIELSTFFMDTYEVTYSEYQECVKAGGCPPVEPNYRNGYRNPKQPMLGVNWYHARDYCKWRGKRLPTEAEWEKAARGDNGELYPWGNAEADCTRAIIQEKGVKGCGTGKTWDVGSRPAGRYGLYDMAGNSWEWVQDWYSESYGACGKQCEGKDPKGPCNGEDRCPKHTEKVVRGGSWWWDAVYTLGSNRRPHYPSNNPYHHFGFRCARSAEAK